METTTRDKGFNSYEEWMNLLDELHKNGIRESFDHRSRPWVLLIKEEDGFLTSSGFFSTKEEAEQYKQFKNNPEIVLTYKGYPHYESKE